MNEAVDGCRNKLEQVYRLGYENGRLDEIESYNKDNKNEENIFDKFCSCMTCKYMLIKLNKRGWDWSSDTICTICTNKFKYQHHINPLWRCANYEKDKNWQDLIKKIILLG